MTFRPPNQPYLYQIVPGTHLVVDEESLEAIDAHCWRVYSGESFVSLAPEPGLILRRYLVNAEKGMKVFHRNRDLSDYRLSNLIVAYTKGHVPEYICDSTARDWCLTKWGYYVQVAAFGERTSLGTYDTKEEAEKVARDFRNKIAAHLVAIPPPVNNRHRLRTRNGQAILKRFVRQGASAVLAERSNEQLAMYQQLVRSAKD